MKNLCKRSVLGLLTLAMAACASNPTRSEPSPTSPQVQATSESDRPAQPDLIVDFMALDMEGRQGHCVSAYSTYGIRVIIKNVGAADAGPFMVDLNGTHQDVPAGLPVGQSIDLYFAGTVPSGRYQATADVTDQVVESREENNTYSYLAPTPTPPLLCTPTATAAP